MRDKNQNPYPECEQCEKHAGLDGCSLIADKRLCPPLRFRKPAKNGGQKPAVKLN